MTVSRRVNLQEWQASLKDAAWDLRVRMVQAGRRGRDRRHDETREIWLRFVADLYAEAERRGGYVWLSPRHVRIHLDKL